MLDRQVLDTTIEEYDAFGSVVVTTGEQVFLYRRLQDAHDKSLIAVVNELNDVIGYLNREIAETVVLPALKEGARFQCIITGEPEGNTVPIQIKQIAQSEVSAILARRGGPRRVRAGGVSPLAGVFDDDVALTDPDEVDLEEIDELDEE